MEGKKGTCLPDQCSSDCGTLQLSNKLTQNTNFIMSTACCLTSSKMASRHDGPTLECLHLADWMCLELLGYVWVLSSWHASQFPTQPQWVSKISHGCHWGITCLLRRMKGIWHLHYHVVESVIIRLPPTSLHKSHYQANQFLFQRKRPSLKKNTKRTSFESPQKPTVRSFDVSLRPRANLGCEAERFTAISPAETFCRRTSTSCPRKPKLNRLEVSGSFTYKRLRYYFTKLLWFCIGVFFCICNEWTPNTCCETFFCLGGVILEMLKTFGKGLQFDSAPQNVQVEEHQPCVRVLGTLPYPTPHPQNCRKHANDKA